MCDLINTYFYNTYCIIFMPNNILHDIGTKQDMINKCNSLNNNYKKKIFKVILLKGYFKEKHLL